MMFCVVLFILLGRKEIQLGGNFFKAFTQLAGASTELAGVKKKLCGQHSCLNPSGLCNCHSIK